MRLYFIGICGTAMGHAALLLRDAGHAVAGSDAQVYPPMSDLLREQGVTLHEGYDAGRLAGDAPDLVVVGNAASRGNPEIEWLLDQDGVPYLSLPAILARELLPGRRRIVVAGTHGKTTTTALTAQLLRANGEDPGWLVGGVPLDLPGGACSGKPGSPFVIEGDEYDSAFFDKRSKFIHYRPHILVLNNCEFDHGDIFRDQADIERTFRHLLRTVPRSGTVITNADDPVLERLVAEVDWAPVVRVGLDASADIHIADFREDRDGTRFRIEHRDGAQAVAWRLPGLFNARNATMAAAAAGLACPGGEIGHLDLQSLTEARGVRRRQEIRLETPDLVVIEDFGHHPTAIAGTLESLRLRYPEHRLTACFEPRSNTGVTRVFQERFEEALRLADACYLAPLFRAERLPSGERLDAVGMAERMTQRGTCSGAFDSFETLLAELTEATRSKTDHPRCVVFFSNGAFGGILPRYIATVTQG
ncbi:MAG: UDP-N-acetylmuramate--L-alanine ligase [Opitutales bacterium]